MHRNRQCPGHDSGAELQNVDRNNPDCIEDICTVLQLVPSSPEVQSVNNHNKSFICITKNKPQKLL